MRCTSSKDDVLKARQLIFEIVFDPFPKPFDFLARKGLDGLLNLLHRAGHCESSIGSGNSNGKSLLERGLTLRPAPDLFRWDSVRYRLTSAAAAKSHSSPRFFFFPTSAKAIQIWG